MFSAQHPVSATIEKNYSSYFDFSCRFTLRAHLGAGPNSSNFNQDCSKLLNPNITFFKRGPTDPSQHCKTASNSIQDPPPRWILTIFKLKFGGGNLFSQAMTSSIEGNNFVGSPLKPLLKKVTP
jgi:hypothetical protein